MPQLTRHGTADARWRARATQVAFLPAPNAVDDALFIIGRIVDAIFVLDMLLQCFLMVPKAGDPSKLETRWSAILRMYAQGWLMLDLLAIGASAFDYLPFVLSTTHADRRKSPVASFRVVRVLRLVKLLRLLKASRRLKEAYVKIAWPRAVVTIFSTMFECGIVIHLVACALGIVTIVPPTVLDTWLATHGFCTPAGGVDEWGQPRSLCLSPIMLYFQSFWWAAGMLLGAPISLSPHKGPFPEFYSGRAAAVDSAEANVSAARAPDAVDAVDPYGNATKFTLLEEVVILLLKIFTAFEWVTVIARFVQVYNNLDPEASDFRMGWYAPTDPGHAARPRGPTL